MRSLFSVFALLLAGLAAPLAAQPDSAQLAAAAAAEDRGKQLFAYDQAAWHATDQFQEDMARQGINIGTMRARGLAGYIVEPEDGSSLSAVFYGVRNGHRFAMARYSVRGSTVTHGGLIEADGASPLSLLADRMIDARDAASAAMKKPDHDMCSSSPANTLVLPPDSNGLLSVYYLTSTVDPNIYPAGGHFRFDFDADGKQVGERRFTNSCLPLTVRGRGGDKPVALYLTHLLDPQPTEIHVFVSLNAQLPVMVGTSKNNEVWSVAEGHVRYVKDLGQTK